MAVMFSEITGRNILIGEEVDGKVTAKLTNVPWDKALDSILKIKKLAILLIILTKIKEIVHFLNSYTAIMIC